MAFADEMKEAWLMGMRENARMSAFVRDIGFRLASMSDSQMRVLRNMVAAAQPEDAFRKGIALAVVEMVDGHRDALAAGQRTEATRETAARLGLTHRILTLLQNAVPLTTGDIAHKLGVDDDDVSRALGKLRRDDLIETDQRPGTSRRLRWHRLSPAGEQALATWPAAVATDEPMDEAGSRTGPVAPASAGDHDRARRDSPGGSA
ncbi:MAG TPA: hypothetical protein VHE35_12185 [Kofleriaceae bacterium]|nr:hypothetical protein [Kofleriaceae bacterium]